MSSNVKMKTACNHEVQLLALSFKLAGVAHSFARTPTAAGQLVAAQAAALVLGIKAYVDEHRAGAHAGEEGHSESCLASAEQLVGQIEKTEAEFFEIGPQVPGLAETLEKSGFGLTPIGQKPGKKIDVN